ncbi:hypothetical protein [Metamycoplasma orale]|uniref:Uncharacterized protein n=1 Tax=Metamycoplasma orale TaxID=2121 RepID=A0A448ZWZ5_METOS|nr:hypothetical protein [Metamycoplasma orale]VEU55623.1 Uncharacterised protein [Metamycoplasma orale]
MKGGKTINKDNDNFNGPFGETTFYVKLSLSEIKKLMNKYSNLNCAMCQFSNYEDYKFLVVRYQEEDMKVKPLTPPKAEPIITKEVIMQIAFAVKELIQPDIDEIKVRLDKVEQRLDKVEKDIVEIKKDIIELKSDVAMLKSFHIEDIKNYKATN